MIVFCYTLMIEKMLKFVIYQSKKKSIIFIQRITSNLLFYISTTSRFELEFYQRYELII